MELESSAQKAYSPSWQFWATQTKSSIQKTEDVILLGPAVLWISQISPAEIAGIQVYSQWCSGDYVVPRIEPRSVAGKAYIFTFLLSLWTLVLHFFTFEFGPHLLFPGLTPGSRFNLSKAPVLGIKSGWPHERQTLYSLHSLYGPWFCYQGWQDPRFDNYQSSLLLLPYIQLISNSYDFVLFCWTRNQISDFIQAKQLLYW